jgi:hypothetical protein
VGSDSLCPKTVAMSEAPAQGLSTIVRTLGETQALVQGRAQALSRPRVDRTCIGIVVHGIGEQPVGFTLKTIVSEFLRLLRGTAIDRDASIAATPLDEGDPHEVKLWFKAVDKRDEKEYVYELRFIEVWWAKGFQPIGVGRFVLISLGVLWGYTKRVWQKRAGFFSDIQYWGPALWQRVLVQPLIPTLAIAALLVLIIVRVIQIVIPKDKVPQVIATATNILVNATTMSLGDMWQYMTESWESSRIRVRFEERFRQVVELADQASEARSHWERLSAKDKRATDELPVVESIFVIGHSMGSAVAYEALTGRRMTALLKQRFDDNKVGLQFISVGSALNRAWDLIPKEEKFRFHRQISPHVHWLNLWSGPDPVARGPLGGPVLDENSDPEWNRDRVGPNGKQKVADEDLMVINQSDMFSDHSAYWNNAEEVIAPILDKITNGAFHTRLTLKKTSRRSRVSVLAMLKAVALLVVPVVGFLSAITGVDTSVIDFLVQDAFGLKPDWLKKEYLSPLVVSTVAGILAAFLYSTIVKWLWDKWDEAVKYRPADPNPTQPVA